MVLENCNLVLYDDMYFKGISKEYSGDTDLAAGHHHRDRDHSAKLSGSCKNTSYLVFEAPWSHKDWNGGLAYLIGESDAPGNMYKTYQSDYEKGRYWIRGGRGDNIVRINIPREDINAGRMREDIKVMGKSNTGNAGDTHLHLYRDKNGNPNAIDQWLTGIYNDQNSITKGQPCPGGDAYWKNAINPEISCVYNNKEGLQNLHANSTANNDIRRIMWNTLVNRYCDRAERLDERVGTNTTCRNIVNAKAQAKSYCQGVPSRIATDKTFCTKSELGEDIYKELAETYCKANPTADFCACYNVTKNLCTEQPDLPGCKIVQPIWDTIKETLDEGDIAQFEGMQPCYGSVCTGNVYQPDKWDANCNKNISICKADFKIGGDLVGSNISLKQDCGNTTNEGGGSGGGSGSGSSETTTTNNDDDDDDDDKEKTLIEKIFKLKEDKDKKFIEKRVVKVGGGILSLIFCLLCIITLIMFA